MRETQLARASVLGKSTNESTCNASSSGRSRRKSRLSLGEMCCEMTRSSCVVMRGRSEVRNASRTEGARCEKVARRESTLASSWQ